MKPFFIQLKLLLLVLTSWAIFSGQVWALGQDKYVVFTEAPDLFPLHQGNDTATLYVDNADWPGVARAATDLQGDLNRITGHTPAMVHEAKTMSPTMVLIGTLGKSLLIDQLVRDKKIDVTSLAGKWESFFLQTVANPLPGVTQALVIVGSDKRGTIYGVYDLSEQMGVSPWYWWADVPVPHHDAVFVHAGKFQQGEPSVKYRGIFLNDESPDLTNWVTEKFGNVPGLNGVANYNHEFYAKVFELILRLKGNYLWPAMWNNAFNEDDPESPRLADEYGIVMGTSHQEPMLRGQKEWDRSLQRANGNWNFSNVAQQPVLEQFWRDGVKRNRNFESIITLGLRAENDSGAPIGADLTGQVVALQRKILAEEVNPDVTKIPQLWCLYKEVMDYYNAGLHPPDDVTLLWADDNWGDVRRLPTTAERQRSGGAGIYYHFDYHGGPRNYQWINSSPLPKIWDQMSLAKQYGADRIWIVNVGHLKGEEIPIEYFLSLGWNSTRWTNDNIGEFTRLWAAREFGPEHAADIADLVSQYAKYNARRKPELLEPATYSLTDYNEADSVVADYNSVAARARAIYDQLPPPDKDAFNELVLFPAQACAQLNEMYVAAAKSQLYAQQGRVEANYQAARALQLFQADGDLMSYFNHTFANGRWDHFMDQVHIGYTMWNSPARDIAPRVGGIDLQPAAKMNVAIEGSAECWPTSSDAGSLPAFDVFNQQHSYIDVYNSGQGSFNFSAATSAPWIILSADHGTVDREQRLGVTLDWSKVPADWSRGTITLSKGEEKITVLVSAFNPAEPARTSIHGFVEGRGVVSIEAEHYTNKNSTGNYDWIKIEDYGRTLSAMRSVAPSTAPSATPGQNSASLEYRMYLFKAGSVQTNLTVAPTLNFDPTRGLRLAVSFDDEAPQTVDIVPQNFTAQNGNREWEESVKDNVRIVHSTHNITQPGYHTLKIWAIDPAVVLEKIVVDTGGLKKSYLGPPESFHRD